MKLFRTNDINVVTECQLNFHFQLPSVLLKKRREKFINVMVLWSDVMLDCSCVIPLYAYCKCRLLGYYYYYCCSYCACVLSLLIVCYPCGE